MGAASGSLNGIVILGAFFPCCNWIGAVAGSLVSYAVMLWINIGKYTVIGSSEILEFPTSNCSSDTDISLLNLTSLYSEPTHSPGTILDYSTMTDIQLAYMSSTAVSEMITESPSMATSVNALTKLYSLSYLWFSTFGTLVCVIVGLIVSLITGPTKRHEVPPKYLIPVFDIFCCCLPQKIRTFLHCNIDHTRIHENEQIHEEQINTSVTDPNVYLSRGSKEDQPTVPIDKTGVNHTFQNDTGAYQRYKSPDDIDEDTKM
ncbi:sodium-dependent multivitamin transporter-like [Mizuhopecten yessoensis]|uniref:sodium-dependent multivitamin transporter-like n=1 Tax=Mizuhopecten yessoensis TaxID=6573 RepID=UPI000B45F697|nr:sodium-dependent multivitamin transporter-like [Mizuhopecten yessoensis]